MILLLGNRVLDMCDAWRHLLTLKHTTKLRKFWASRVIDLLAG